MGEKSMKRSRGILRSAAAYGRDTARVLRWECRRPLRSGFELLQWAMNLLRKVVDLSYCIRFHRRKWKCDLNSPHDVFESLISSVTVAWNVQIHAFTRIIII